MTRYQQLAKLGMMSILNSSSDVPLDKEFTGALVKYAAPNDEGVARLDKYPKPK